MLRFALVGCGRIAQRHAQLLGRGEVAGATLAGVCDVDEERARKLGEQLGVPFFTDMFDMADRLAFDVFSVLTPSGLHAKHVIGLAPYGKPIVVEKPMALTVSDADAMIEACGRHGCQLFVVKQNRFNLPVVKLKEALDTGRFGRLVLGTVRVRWCRRQDYYDQDSWRGTWELDGGVLANQASHHVDLLEWMLGDVVSVVARATTALVDIEAEDTAVAILRFENGALGVVEATTATRPIDLEGSLSILGEKGTVVIGGFAVNEITTWAFEAESPEDNRVRDEFSVNPPDVYGFGHKAYYENVVNSIARAEPALVNGEQGRRSLELISAIYESIESGGEISLPPATKKSRLGVTL